MEDRSRESKEERAKRHQEKAKAVQAHRSQIRAQLSRQNASQKLRGSTQFHCPLKFDNRLPEVPIEPKLLSFPFDTEQSFEYNQRRGPALEETYAYALHTEIDVGVPIDLVDTKLYEPPAVQAPMHELDRFITNPLFGTVQPKKAPVLDLKTEVEWLMAPEVTDKKLEGVAARAAGSARASAAAAKPAHVDRSVAGSMVERILQSFDAVDGSRPLKHPTNPDLVPVQQWSLMPDVEKLNLDLVNVMFDANPDDAALRTKRKLAPVSASESKRRLCRSVIASPAEAPTHARGLLGCFYLPTAGSTVDDVSDRTLQFVQDYNMAVTPLSATETAETIVLVLEPSGKATFLPLKARIEMTKLKGLKRRPELRVSAVDGVEEDVPDSPTSPSPPPSPSPRVRVGGGAAARGGDSGPPSARDDRRPRGDRFATADDSGGFDSEASQ